MSFTKIFETFQAALPSPWKEACYAGHRKVPQTAPPRRIVVYPVSLKGEVRGRTGATPNHPKEIAGYAEFVVFEIIAPAYKDITGLQSIDGVNGALHIVCTVLKKQFGHSVRLESELDAEWDNDQAQATRGERLVLRIPFHQPIIAVNLNETTVEIDTVSVTAEISTP